MLTNSFACDDILEFSEPAVNDKTSHMFDSKFTLIIQRSPSVGFEFLVSATQGSYVIEASIDLINWNLVTKQPLIPDERLLIVPNISHCFYRARLFTPAPGLRLQ